VRAEPDQLAWHYEQAGEHGLAVAHRREAGRLALTRSAHEEAADHLGRALHDLQTSDDRAVAADLELDVRILLGNALISWRGYASADAAACYERARELCEGRGDDSRELPVLYGLWVNAFVRARHGRALELGFELRALAERRDPSVLVVAERAVGWPLICMARFEDAREHLDRVVQLQPADPRPLRFLYGQDPAAAGIATGAWALWGCRDPSGDARAEEAIVLARATEHPLTIAYALGAGALVAALREDAHKARERAVEAIAVTDDFGFPLWRAWSKYALGAAELLDGQPERAAATLRSGVSEARATGAALFEPFALTKLAEAELASGRPDEAARCVEGAEAAASAGGELFWQPETQRVRAALPVGTP
jgi:hypothetical protein